MTKPADKTETPSTEQGVQVLPLVELPREKQPWYRPPDSKFRKKAEKIVVMRAAGRQDAYIAKKMGTTAGNIAHIMYIARKNEWLDDNDEPIDLELEMAETVDRKIVRNINASLDGMMTNWQTHEMTIAAAKGRGHFKNHEKTDGQQPQMAVVAIQVVMPALGAADQKVIDEDSIGGVPAYIEGEVEDGPDTRPTLEAGDTATGPEGAVGVDAERQTVSA